MSHNEARSWWADVEHLRDRLEQEQGGAPSAQARPPIADDPAPRERRTVRITGHGSGAITPRPLVETGHRRSASSGGAARAARRPDHFALWAVFLGFALVLVAVTSGHA